MAEAVGNKDVVPAPAAGPTWPTLGQDHPISKLLIKLPDLIKEADYDEIYGIQLRNENSFYTKLVLQKFLRATSNNVEEAQIKILETLKWRKQFQPLKAKDETFSKERFGGLGYIVPLEQVPESSNAKDIATFNIYGAVKDNKATFGDLDTFLRWRVALMEMSVEALRLSEATKPIPDFGEGPDPYQGFQIHDYLQISFLRQDPDVKAASKAAIEIFSKYYPETLSRKFFVNVPVLMGWMFSAMKMILSRETVKKFTVLSYGENLVSELGPSVPKVYGGQGPDLEASATQPRLTSTDVKT